MRTNRPYPLKIVNKNQQEPDWEFWKDRSPEERISAVEFLREQYYAIIGHQSTPALIRKLTLVERFK